MPLPSSSESIPIQATAGDPWLDFSNPGTMNPLQDAAITRWVLIPYWKVIFSDAILILGIAFLIWFTLQFEPVLILVVLVSLPFLFAVRILLNRIPLRHLLDALHPHSKDLWMSGVGLSQIVKAHAMENCRLHPGKRIASILFGLSCIATPLILFGAARTFPKSIPVTILDWIRLATVLGVVCTCLGVVIGHQRPILIWLSVSWAVRILTLPLNPKPHSRDIKASQMDILSLPAIRGSFPVVVVLFPLLFFQTLLLFSVCFPRREMVTVIPLLFLVLTAVAFLRWIRRLPQRIENHIHWLQGKGTREFDLRHEMKFGGSS